MQDQRAGKQQSQDSGSESVTQSPKFFLVYPHCHQFEPRFCHLIHHIFFRPSEKALRRSSSSLKLNQIWTGQTLGNAIINTCPSIQSLRWKGKIRQLEGVLLVRVNDEFHYSLIFSQNGKGKHRDVKSLAGRGKVIFRRPPPLTSLPSGLNNMNLSPLRVIHISHSLFQG